MPADDLTPAQVAALLEVDASTLRRWARAFPGYLSAQAQGKRRRYTSADLAVLTRAQGLLRGGKSPAEVDGLLATVPDAGAEPGMAPAVVAVSLPGLTLDLQATQEALRAALAALDSLRAEQGAQAAALAAQAAKIEQLEQQMAAWQALPWWRRVFGRPPAAPK